MKETDFALFMVLLGSQGIIIALLIEIANGLKRCNRDAKKEIAYLRDELIRGYGWKDERRRP